MLLSGWMHGSVSTSRLFCSGAPAAFQGPFEMQNMLPASVRLLLLGSSHMHARARNPNDGLSLSPIRSKGTGKTSSHHRAQGEGRQSDLLLGNFGKHRAGLCDGYIGLQTASLPRHRSCLCHHRRTTSVAASPRKLWRRQHTKWP